MFIISFAVLLLSLTANAKDCFLGKLRYLKRGKRVVENSTYCFLKSIKRKTPYIVSQKCYLKKCEIIKNGPHPVVVTNSASNYGTPGFKLCEKLQGSPQLFEYKTKNKWFETGRCIFGHDSYVEIPYLIDTWQKFILWD